MATAGDQFGLAWDDAEHCRLVPLAEADEVVTIEVIADNGLAYCQRPNGAVYVATPEAIDAVRSPVTRTGP